MRSLTRPAGIAVLMLAAATLAGCGLFGAGTSATSSPRATASASPPATATATAESDDDDGESRSVSVLDLEIGMCFDDPEDTDRVEFLDVVSCKTPHDNEVYALIDHPGDDFPGQEALTDFADEECRGDTFEDYVGTNYDDSVLYFTALWPTEESWAGGDREVVCILYEPDEKLTESQRDSNR